MRSPDRGLKANGAVSSTGAVRDMEVRHHATSMCGISGFTTRDPARDVPIAERQIRLLEHRGPDAHGWWSGSGCVLAQNRLAIIDVEGGDPPITNEDGTVGVVLNGEIYNFR